MRRRVSSGSQPVIRTSSTRIWNVCELVENSCTRSTKNVETVKISDLITLAVEGSSRDQLTFSSQDSYRFNGIVSQRLLLVIITVTSIMSFSHLQARFNTTSAAAAAEATDNSCEILKRHRLLSSMELNAF